MKNKYLWYLNALLALVALLLTYRIWFAPRNDVWNFIPENAFVIVESSQIQESLFDTKNQQATQLADVPFFFDANEQLHKLTQIVDNQELSSKFLTKKLISYSLHRETKKNLEYVVYIPAGNFGDADFINKLLQPDLSKRKIFARTFRGIKVNELFEMSGKSIINFFVHDDFLIYSTSKILLEDVITRIKSGIALDRSPFSISRKGIAHIYFKSRNLQNISDILPSQLSPNLIDFFGNITPRNPDIVFEKIKEPNLVSAYVNSSGSSSVPFLGIFGKQNPKPIQSVGLIPEKTAILLRLSFHDKKRLAEDFTNYLKANNPSISVEKDSVNRFLKVNLNQIYSVLKDEIVLCEMETQADEPSKKILLLKTEDSAEALNLLDEFATKAENLTPYLKAKPFTYLNYFIRKAEISQLPALLFGSSFQGFSECYYTIKDDYLILASDDEAMRTYLNDLNVGQTWAKTAVYTDFLKKLRPQAQVTAVISPQRIWNNLYNSLPQKWQNSMAKHEPRAKNIRLIGVENFVKDANFGTKILIAKQPKSNLQVSNKLFLQDSLLLNQPIVSQYLIKNPQSGDEIIVQQADSKLLLFDSKVQKINELAISTPLKSNYLIATDYLQNGWLHYLATTPTNLAVLSRDTQKGIQITSSLLPTTNEITSFTANETTIVASTSTEIYQIDTETQKVSRIKLPSGVTDIVRALPVKFKNHSYIAFLQKDGTLGVIYENGGYLKGFPKVPIAARPIEMIVESDAESNSILTLVSELGEIKKIDMNAQIVESIQIEKTEKTTNFEAVFDQTRKDWLIARRTPTNLILFDKRGNSLVEIQNTNFMQSQLKYTDLGNDLRILVVFDGKNNTLFDLKGNMLGDKSIAATGLPTISYSTTYNKIFVYNPNGKRLEVWSVKVL